MSNIWLSLVAVAVETMLVAVAVLVVLERVL
jgi:hypothetical protein